MASDAFTDIVRTSWIGRIGNAIKGVVIGGVLLLVGAGVLFWNEGRAVKTARGLEEGEKVVLTVSAEAIDPANEKKLICFNAQATSDQRLSDAQFGVAPRENLLKLYRDVQMYQWKETEHTRTERQGGREVKRTTYSYDRTWSSRPIDSHQFRNPSGHENPPMPFSPRTFTASPIKAGAFVLSHELAAKIENFERFPVAEPASAGGEPAVERADDAPPQPTVQGLKVMDGIYYRGNDPASPQIGDLKIAFSVARPGPITVIAQQAAGQLAPWRTHTGTQILELRHGTHSAADVFAMAQAENRTLTWLIRLGGFIAVFIGLLLIVAPLRVLVDVVPFLGDLVGMGTFLVSLILSIALTVLVIGIGWLFYRPLLSIVLFAAAALGVVLLKRMGKSRRASRPAPPATLPPLPAPVGAGLPPLPPLPALPPDRQP